MTRIRCEYSLCVFCAVSGAATAQDVSINATNTLRVERYDTRGFTGASPYPISTSAGFDEWLVNLGWQPRAYDRWRATFAGVVNDSPYRSPDRGVVPERIVIARENGEAAIPYRIEAGDFFAFTSFRTQQRSLKGVAVELQPVPAGDTYRSSVLLFGGAAQPSWRHLQWNDDNSLGVSWLNEWRDKRLTVNVLRSERGANAIAAARDQTIASLAADLPLQWGPLRLRAEAELATLRGDTETAMGQKDSGLFAQLAGSYAQSNLNWRLRGERYGAGYQPFGAAVTPDRRSAEAHVAGLVSNSLSWRARAQRFRDQAESANPQDTDVIGASLSGPWPALGATVHVDLFSQSLKRRDGSTDQDALTFNALLVKPMRQWVLQTSLLYQTLDDNVVTANQPRTRQINVSALKPLQWGSWNGSIGPGLTWRKVTGGTANSNDVTANLALNLAGGPHRFALSAGRLAQSPSLSTSPDVATINLGLDYRFRTGRHEFGFDLALFDRKPKPGEKTEAIKAGLVWIVQFDRPARSGARPVANLVSSPATPLSRNASLLADVAPGADFRATQTRLAAAGLTGGVAQGPATVFETRLLSDIEARQRVVVVESAGRVERTGLLISLDTLGGADDAARLYDRVLRNLIEALGRPATTFEQGAFSAQYANDIASGALVRIAEWVTDAGTLRVGLPRRLDGLARIEIIHAPSFGSPRDTQWGIETIR
ncbi:MAG: hypothetical protein JNM76_02130 [Betaproteobacteria bacterium]|nr:hypothetical protein [Betaproteobacteria bacterium]